MDAETLTPARPKFTWLVALAVALVLFAVVGVYSLRISHETLSYDQETAQDRYTKLQKLRDDDAKTLGTAAWMDQSKGTVRIPIDEAMTEELSVLRAKPVQMGLALPGAAPAAPASTATNIAPANTIPAKNSPSGTNTAPDSAANPPSQ